MQFICRSAIDRIDMLLRQKQPQAVVTVGLALGYTPILLEDPRLNIPSVTVMLAATLTAERRNWEVNP